MKNDPRSGFSPIEILVVVVIATLVVLVVSNLSSNVSSLNGLVNRELQSRANTDQILQLVTTDIRSMSLSANGAYPIIAAGTSSLSFYTNGANGGVVKQERYFLGTSSIWRGVIQPTGTPAVYNSSTEVLTDMIDNIIVASSVPLFSYYDSSYTGSQPALTSTADVSPIRAVGISFSATIESGGASRVETFTRLIDIRNLRSN